MKFERREAPYIAATGNVASVMQHVLFALVPAALGYVWFFGPGFILNFIVAAIFCIGGEAAMLRLRNKAVKTTLYDFSAIVTAALIAFALQAFARLRG